MLDPGAYVVAGCLTRGRRRPRRKVTPERLAEIARVVAEHATAPTRAVMNHEHVSRVYALELIRQAEEAGLG
jgi:hypothetical protein